MTVKTNAQGAKRKELVNDIAEWLAVTPTYCGAPTFAYKAGGITIDKNGAIDLPTDLESEVAERLLEHLFDNGFEIDMSDVEEEPTGISIQMPLSEFTETALANLKRGGSSNRPKPIRRPSSTLKTYTTLNYSRTRMM